MTKSQAQAEPYSLGEYAVPCCMCGAPAHLVDMPRVIGGVFTNHFYGVMCDGKKRHHTPLGFSTPRSALTFWQERFAADEVPYADT